MNVLMTLAAVGAAAIGQWSEARSVVFLFSLGTCCRQRPWSARGGPSGRLVRARAAGGARCVDGAGERQVAGRSARAGDLIRLLPGERLPVDGVVSAGRGRRRPGGGHRASRCRSRKAAGDHVFAGAIVAGRHAHVRATSGAGDNTIAKIIHLVEEAQAQRAPVETVVDRFASRYTPVVVVFAILVAVLPPALRGAALHLALPRPRAAHHLLPLRPGDLDAGEHPRGARRSHAARRAGQGRRLPRAGGAHRGRGLRQDRHPHRPAGRAVTDVVSLDGAAPADLLAMAAGVERGSEHPLAAAILARAQADARGRCRPASASAPWPARACAPSGRPDGTRRPAGALRAVRRRSRAVTELLARLEEAGRTAVLVGTPEGPLGPIAVADPCAPARATRSRALRALGVRAHRPAHRRQRGDRARGRRAGRRRRGARRPAAGRQGRRRARAAASATGR